MENTISKIKLKIKNCSKSYYDFCYGIISNIDVYYLFAMFFIALAIILFYRDYFSMNRSFIWSVDAAKLYMPKIIWFNRFIKQIIYNLINNHKLIIPMWEFNLGEGTDIIQGFGGHIFSNDVLILLSPFFSEEDLPYYYSFCQLLRLFLCGISFIYLCKVLDKKNKLAILISSLTYTFCAWNLYNLNRHYFFINWVIYFPMFVAGIECILKGRKPYLYIVVLSLIFFDIYYAYMVVLLSLIYIPLRVFTLGYKNVCFVKMCVKIFLYSVLALIISSILFLPNAFILLNENRANVLKNIMPVLFYRPVEYLRMIRSFISYDMIGWIMLGYTSVTFISVIWLFLKKKYKIHLKILVLIAMLFLTFPLFGKIFNGGGYVTNRWTFSLALLFCVVLEDFVEHIGSINLKQIYVITFFSIIYYFLSDKLGFIKVHNSNFINEIIILLSSLVIIYIMSTNNRFSVLNKSFLLVLCFASIIENSNYLNNSDKLNYSKEALPYSEYYSKMYDTTAKFISENTIDDGEYFRYNLRNNDKIRNATLIEKLSSQEYFTSFTNPYLQQFFKLLYVPRSMGHLWINYDNNYIIDTLNSVKYTTMNKNGNEYGYTLYKTNEKIDLLAKEKFLPLMYSYDSYISTKEFLKYNPIQKQEIMVQSAVIDEYDNKRTIHHNDELHFAEKNCKFNYVSKNDNIYWGNNYIVTFEDNVKIDIETDIPINTESHFVVYNLNYIALHDYDLYFKKDYKFGNSIYVIDPNNKYDINKLSKENKDELQFKYDNWYDSTTINLSFNYIKNKYSFDFYNFKNISYGGYHDFNFNLGYNKNKIDKITITLSKKGLYTFDDIKIVALPLDRIDERIDYLYDDEIKDIEIDSNRISSYVDFSSDKFVCCAMPYYPGWKAFIDGKEVKLYKTNIRHMGIDVPAGEHKIEFRYKNYYLIYGAIISLFGVLTFISIILYNKKKDRIYGYYQ